MSTKASIKYRENTKDKPGFHLFDDVLDTFDDESDPPVYLELSGVAVSLDTLPSGGACVVLTLPREMAKALGLLSFDPPVVPLKVVPKE